MHSAFTVPIEFIVTVLAADLAAGFIHWVEDAYVREDWPVVGRLIARPNILHHHLPRHFTRKTWLESCWDQLLIAGLLVWVAGLLGWLTWHVFLFALLVGNANEIHKWAHRSRRENGPVISLLHDLRLLQTPRHHARHHTDPKDSHYCVITDFLNPPLERIRFWTRLEVLVRKTTGFRRRADTSNRRHGPPPSWLRAFAIS
jgi:plasmanylethanolamine desaturase